MKLSNFGVLIVLFGLSANLNAWEFNPDGTPTGDWRNSCEEITVTGTRLNALCSTVWGTKTWNQYDLYACPFEQEFHNCNGVFSCGACVNWGRFGR